MRYLLSLVFCIAFSIASRETHAFLPSRTTAKAHVHPASYERTLDTDDMTNNRPFSSCLVTLSATSSRNLKNEKLNKYALRREAVESRTSTKATTHSKFKNRLNQARANTEAAINASETHALHQKIVDANHNKPPQQDDDTDRLGNLLQLTQLIDQELRSSPTRPSLLARQERARDSMRALLEADQNISRRLSTTTKEKYSLNRRIGDNSNNSPTSRNIQDVAILFAKPLLYDKLTVECAWRIRTLAKAIMDGSYRRPSLICFVGEVTAGNLVAGSTASYLFFLQLCEANQISLDGIDFYIEKQGEPFEAIQSVMSHIQSHSLPGWLQGSSILESSTDEFGEKRIQPRRKKLHIHFTLFSTAYHLCNLNDIHCRSPRQSLLRPIQDLPSTALDKGGVVEATWGFRHTDYPYFHKNKDPIVAFLAKCFLLGEGLTPVLYNLQGVVNNSEFFQRDNYLALVSIRRSLVSDMEDFYRNGQTLKSSLRQVYTNNDFPIEVVLEGALLSLGRCLDLVRPAGLLKGSVISDDWQQALSLMQHVVTQLRLACDPDVPIDPSTWPLVIESDQSLEVN